MAELTINMRTEEEEEVSLSQRASRESLQGLPMVTSDVTLVDPVEIRKKPGPASRIRPDIRERWGGNTPGQQSASVSQVTDGRKRLASPEEEEKTRKRRPEEESIDSDNLTTESGATKAPTPPIRAFLREGRGKPYTSGRYIGTAKAKRALLKVQEREMKRRNSSSRRSVRSGKRGHASQRRWRSRTRGPIRKAPEGTSS
jgi:hypothetical protein